MRKKLFALLAAVVLVLSSGGSAQAATNGNHIQTFSGCGHSVTLSYRVSGIGDPVVNTSQLLTVAWSSQLGTFDRLSVYGLRDIFNGDVRLYQYGGSADTHGDVPASHVSDFGDDPNRAFLFDNGDPGTHSVNIWDGSCYQQINLNMG